MFKAVSTWKSGLGRAALFAAALALLAAAPRPADAQGKDEQKMKREMRVMESFLDHVTVDSRNVLVGSRHSVNGVYLDGFGALFTFEANLLMRDHGFLSRWFWDDDDDWDWDRHDRRRDRDRDEDDDDSWRDRRDRKEDRLYADMKDEFADALLDYGDSLTQLSASEWVAVAICLDESAHIGDRRLSRVTIKARVSDLRDYAAKRLSHDAAKGKLIITEY